MSVTTLEQADVGDEEAADPALDRAGDVLDRVADPARAAHLAEMRRAIGRARVRPDVEALARAHEERDLETGVVTEARHLASSDSRRSIAPIPARRG